MWCYLLISIKGLLLVLSQSSDGILGMPNNQLESHAPPYFVPDNLRHCALLTLLNGIIWIVQVGAVLVLYFLFELVGKDDDGVWDIVAQCYEDVSLYLQIFETSPLMMIQEHAGVVLLIQYQSVAPLLLVQGQVSQLLIQPLVLVHQLAVLSPVRGFELVGYRYLLPWIHITVM